LLVYESFIDPYPSPSFRWNSPPAILPQAIFHLRRCQEPNQSFHSVSAASCKSSGPFRGFPPPPLQEYFLIVFSWTIFRRHRTPFFARRQKGMLLEVTPSPPHYGIVLFFGSRETSKDFSADVTTVDFVEARLLFFSYSFPPVWWV